MCNTTFQANVAKTLQGGEAVDEDAQAIEEQRVASLMAKMAEADAVWYGMV